MPGNRPHHTDKWRSCVQKVQDKSPGVDPYAVCTANLGPSIESEEVTVRAPNAYSAHRQAQVRKALDDLNGDRGVLPEAAGVGVDSYVTESPDADEPGSIKPGKQHADDGEVEMASHEMGSRCKLCGAPMSAQTMECASGCAAAEDSYAMDWMPEKQYQQEQKGLKKAKSLRKKADKAPTRSVPPGMLPPAKPVAMASHHPTGVKGPKSPHAPQGAHHAAPKMPPAAVAPAKIAAPVPAHPPIPQPPAQHLADPPSPATQNYHRLRGYQ